jgi:hypothetical protein
MAIFKIIPADSVFTSAALDNAFDFDTPGADTLIVDASAFLIATGSASIGALLGHMGAWNVTVNGSIVANNGTGMLLDSSNAAITHQDRFREGRRGICRHPSSQSRNAHEFLYDGRVRPYPPDPLSD